MWKSLILFSALIAIGENQSLLCSDYFIYVNNGGNVEGLITYNPSPATEHNLKVLLSIGAQLPSSYVGKLALSKGTQTVVSDLQNGLPLLYAVKFPISNPLPRILEISHNGLPICFGERGGDENIAYVTTVTLSHKLTLNQVLGNGNQANNNNLYGNNYDNRYFEPQYTTQYTQPQKTSPPTVPSYFQTRRPQVYQPPAIPTFNPFSSSSNSQCGIRKTPNSTPLILGGISAGRAEFPWLVAQFYRSSFICGGSLVSNRVIITASHCIYEMNSDQTTYYLGKHDITRLNEDGFVSSEVERFVIHPNYDPQTFDSDIGAAILTKRIVYTSTIKPICIWTGSQGYADIVRQKGIVAGWGLTEHGSTSSTPMYLSLPVVEESVCLRSHPAFIKITSSKTFCVGDKSGHSPCNGDSGGGFVVKSGQRYYLRGVVSISRRNEDGDCILDDYVVFTDVTVFTGWINNLIETYY